MRMSFIRNVTKYSSRIEALYKKPNPFIKKTILAPKDGKNVLLWSENLSYIKEMFFEVRNLFLYIDKPRKVKTASRIELIFQSWLFLT